MTDAQAPVGALPADLSEQAQPWKRDGLLIYASQEHGWKAGRQLYSNRWSMHVQGGVDRDGQRTPEHELQAIATIAAAAPDAIEACRLFVAYDAAINADDVQMMLSYADALKAAKVALARATGASS